MILTYLQKRWLATRGGRIASDVICIDNQLFVPMKNSKMWVPILVPSDEEIKKELFPKLYK